MSETPLMNYVKLNYPLNTHMLSMIRDEESKLAAAQKALEFYADHIHWMTLTDDSNEPPKLLIANGDTNDTSGWAVAENVLLPMKQAVK